MANDIVKRGPLPAVTFSREFLIELWDNLSQDGEIAWLVKVGTSGDLLGMQEDRPEQNITDWEELLELLESLPRIYSLHIVAEIPDKGVVGIIYKNFNPCGGVLTISTDDKAWGEAKFDSLKEFFADQKENFLTKLYSRMGFGVVQTLIPLSLSFVIVMLAAALLIPAWIRQSELLWWITAGTLVATLRLAYYFSDKMIIYVMKKYPYMRWLS
ncbi:hypothetical protein SDC9_11347 [bioreactor metagenome]|uniref:Uncharacterized protein n=1 Tax=bioreactor metagenome TaxID=1076179 RepID=A0A644TFK5_9ZZZZ|nr:hypothetical protein [Negativicutes bacterium]